jgi:hypothetical protein
VTAARGRWYRGRVMAPLRLRFLRATPLLLVAFAVAAGCRKSGGPAAGTPGAAPPGEDVVCKGSPPVPHPVTGVLRNARCEQDMYISMAGVADQLGVKCNYCHVTLASDPTKEDYPPMTPKKEIANWMSLHLMQSIKPADGSPMKCQSCHTDDAGKPVAKILGNPRTRAAANEWMSEVMVNKFVALDGSKLKCKSCHVGSPSSPEWKPKVILVSDQLPKHKVGVKGTASL